jgi:hypothetical protein
MASMQQGALDIFRHVTVDYIHGGRVQHTYTHIHTHTHKEEGKVGPMPRQHIMKANRQHVNKSLNLNLEGMRLASC